MRTLYQKAGLVHGDLSEYNVMVWEKRPIIFDLSQAVLKQHRLATELLVHDVETVNAYFVRLGVEVYDNEALEEWVKSGEA
jgi:RIO kinase 1